jgi:hypothetical protein
MEAEKDGRMTAMVALLGLMLLVVCACALLIAVWKLTSQRSQPEGPQPNRPEPVVTFLMIFAGIVLLLPAFCTLSIVAAGLISTGVVEGVQGYIRMARMHGLEQLSRWVWALSLCISVLGVVFLWRAVARAKVVAGLMLIFVGVVLLLPGLFLLLAVLASLPSGLSSLASMDEVRSVLPDLLVVFLLFAGGILMIRRPFRS